MRHTRESLTTIAQAEAMTGRRDAANPVHTVTITVQVRAGSPSEAIAKVIDMFERDGVIDAQAEGRSSRMLGAAATYDIEIRTER